MINLIIEAINNELRKVDEEGVPRNAPTQCNKDHMTWNRIAVAMLVYYLSLLSFGLVSKQIELLFKG